MRELYIQGKGKIDCDMILSALLGLGADPEEIRERLEKIFSLPVRLAYETQEKKENGLRIAVSLQEEIGQKRAEAYFKDIEEESRLKENVLKMTALIREAADMPEDQCFLSLTGSETSLVSLTALAIAMDQMGFSRCRVCELEEGFGIGKEKMIPSKEILGILGKSSLLINFSIGQGENFTPGSAAFLAVYGEPAGKTGGKRIAGWSLGVSREGKEQGMVRAVVLKEEKDTPEKKENDQVQVLETNVDDCSGEQLGYAIERLMKAGALDASCFPIFMKKGRPAYMLQVICKKENQEKLEDIIFCETTSIGLRRYEENRRILSRSFKEVTLKDGHKVKIKICTHHGQKFCYPEYDTVRKVCEETGRPYRSIYDEAAALAGGFDNDI